MLVRQCSTIGHFEVVSETGSVLSWIVLWGSLWRCAGDWVKIHPQNSPKVQYLLQQWPGLKHNLHNYDQYMLQKVMLHPVGSVNTHVKHTAIIRLFSFWLLRTSHTYHIRCHVLSSPNMQETNLEGSIQYHTTCHVMTCYSKCFNAQVPHLSLKATMPQFPCIFCSLSSPPRFHKSVTMLSPV